MDTNNILALLEQYTIDNPDDVAMEIANDFRRRRIEKNLTREQLAYYLIEFCVLIPELLYLLVLFCLACLEDGGRFQEEFCPPLGDLFRSYLVLGG